MFSVPRPAFDAENVTRRTVNNLFYEYHMLFSSSLKCWEITQPLRMEPYCLGAAVLVEGNGQGPVHRSHHRDAKQRA
jgi:hypothetical protein